MNVLKPYLRMGVETLLKNGVGQREIARRLGVDPKTTRRIEREMSSKSRTLPPAFIEENEQSAPLAMGVATGFCGDLDPKTPTPAASSESETNQNPAPWPPAFIGENEHIDETPVPTLAPAPAGAMRVSVSACEPHREWIEQQVNLGRNAVSIYQDLVDIHGFNNKYNSVKRFVGGLKTTAPERFDVLEFPPGEEAQVDYGEGAPTLTEAGKYKKPRLFVLTLKYSGKSFRKVVWKSSQEVWARLHEEAFHSLCGCPKYVVPDNLKEGVITPDIYEPTLNAVYAAMLAHYGVVADPCRVRDPDRKGSVENAIQHTQNTLKGRRFKTLDEQNDYLRNWEERWASTRIHGRKKRQVMEMFLEEKPHLKPLPVESFRMFTEGVRMVDDSGLVQVNGAYYSVPTTALRRRVTVRIFEREIEILDAQGALLRRHPKTARKGAFVMEESDRIFNPSRQNALLLHKCDLIGTHTSKLVHTVFAKQGRPGAKMIYGVSNLPGDYTCADIETVCQRMLANGCTGYIAIKKALDRLVEARAKAPPPIDLRQTDPQIRPVDDYQKFWENHSHTNEGE